jgi:phosphosulfolactate synthase
MPFSELVLPAHAAKPRDCGLTCLNDVGTPIRMLEAYLADYASMVDYAKLGVGTACVTPRLKEKVELYRAHGVEVYFGGTLFEKFQSQGKLGSYLSILDDLGIGTIEISNGTIELSLEERVAITHQLRDRYRVLAEVGCKDQQVIMPPSQWVREMTALLAAGARYVVAEGRDSGTAGIYRDSGEIRSGLVSDIAATVDPARIIFEAPKQRDQMFLINLVGSNVSLGNIKWEDVLILETERRALRYETFHHP